MTEPAVTPELPAPPRERPWWERNRRALLTLPLLAVAAVLASSYRYQTLYRPNTFTQPQRGADQSVDFHEKFLSIGFGTRPQPYERTVTINLRSLRAVEAFRGEVAAKGAALWVAELQFAAGPDVPLQGCHVALLDAQGRVYGDAEGKTRTGEGSEEECVPQDAPGPTFDYTGKLNPSSAPRPASWVFTRTVAVPEGVRPKFVRVAWQPPHYALLPAP